MRQIVIVETGTNTRTTIETEATTVAELLEELDNHNINYQGMSLFEGISGSEYSVNRPAAILPSNLPYKGQITNNLVFMLTPEKKNISSGAVDRNELYAIIKENNLQDAVKEVFGRNFTQVSTVDLEKFLAHVKQQGGMKQKPENEQEPEDGMCEECIMAPLLAVLIGLDAQDVISLECLRDNLNYIIPKLRGEEGKEEGEGAKKEPKLPENITEKDIDDMLSGLGY